MLLSAEKTRLLLSAYRIPCAKTVLAANRDGVLSAARRIGFPLVLKVSSRTASHKTEKGLVQVGIHDQNELEHAFSRLSHKAKRFGADSFIVQQHVSGVELLVGGMRDPAFGSAVLFGLGGVYAELFGEVAALVCPFSGKDALALLNQTKARSFFSKTGFRGKKANTSAVIDLLLKTSKLMQNEPIGSFDFNPVIANERGAWVVDARVELL